MAEATENKPKPIDVQLSTTSTADESTHGDTNTKASTDEKVDSLGRDIIVLAREINEAYLVVWNLEKRTQHTANRLTEMSKHLVEVVTGQPVPPDLDGLQLSYGGFVKHPELFSARFAPLTTQASPSASWKL